MGEENSTQQKGTISSQDIPAGNQSRDNILLSNIISAKVSRQITIPGVSGQTGVDAQQTLEDLGLTVTVQKEYSEDDGTGHPLVESWICRCLYHRKKAPVSVQEMQLH